MSMLYWIWKDIQNEILNISERKQGDMGKEFKNKSKTLLYKTQKRCSFILYNVKTINDDKKNLDTLNKIKKLKIMIRSKV